MEFRPAPIQSSTVLHGYHNGYVKKLHATSHEFVKIENVLDGI